MTAELLNNHKRDIDQMIVDLGGPYSTIELILKNKHTTSFILESLNYIASVRHINERATNQLVKPYNLIFKNNKFSLPN
jgi:hypothetical protein